MCIEFYAISCLQNIIRLIENVSIARIASSLKNQEFTIIGGFA